MSSRSTLGESVQDTSTPVSVLGTQYRRRVQTVVTSTVGCTRIGAGHLHSCIGAGYLHCRHIKVRLHEHRCRTPPLLYRCEALGPLHYQCGVPPLSSHQWSALGKSVQDTSTPVSVHCTKYTPVSAQGTSTVVNSTVGYTRTSAGQACN